MTSVLTGPRQGGATPLPAPQQHPVEPSVLLGEPANRLGSVGFLIEQATEAAAMAAYRSLRRDVFVDRQGLFTGSDVDDRDSDPRTIVLIARSDDGDILGGVRLGPALEGPDIGWWQGGRLVSAARSRAFRGVGSALVRAAAARAEAEGALRFDASVQHANEGFFARLGWKPIGPLTVAGTPHVLMQWPIGRIEALVRATKRDLGPLLADLAPGGAGFVGDDGAPVIGTDVVAACDAIIPSMVERDPEWAGWCSVLVNVNDLAAMGATPVGLLDSVGGRDRSFVARVLCGLREAASAYGVPILGGHTQFGVPAALSVTALGRTDHPVPGGAGRPGHAVSLTVDTAGEWRPGYLGRQWDSTSRRSPVDLREMVSAIRRRRPAAAKDVSMAGIVGTLGMLAEASGCAAELDVGAVPRPDTVTSMGDWLTCFPGFAMLTSDVAGATPISAGPARTTECGRLSSGTGIRLLWPDGLATQAITASVTGLGEAGGR